MITRERWQRLKPLLEATLEATPEEVAALLDRTCSDDPELREEAERLLRACEDARHSLDVLDTPAAELAAPLLAVDALVSDTPADLAPGVLVGPYTVERRLGAGGMGVVYLAHDPRLDRKVALKLLPPWLAADAKAKRRFAREATAASRLDHPNIQTVYEIGTAPDGRLYIAMAYYDGETLQDRIARGPMEIDSAIDLAEQIAEGLAAAHAQGIVHRDIKPSNVIVTADGVAKIVDFGAAKVASLGLGVSGTVLGTLAYMSPEQTRSDDVDGRTDLWALGVVTYEMLSGRHPFAGQSAEAAIYGIRHDVPEPLRTHRPEVPEPLVRMVGRCLEKDPEARFPDAPSLLVVLRRPGTLSAGGATLTHRRRQRAVGIAALATVALVGAFVVRPLSVSDPMRLAVLPLTDSTAEEEDAYFTDGVAAELMSRLSRIEALRVVAAPSEMSVPGPDNTPATIARELDVGMLLSGTVRRAGERVELRMRLADTLSPQPLWTQDYTADIEELSTLQRDVAEAVVAVLGIRTRAPERRLLAKIGSESPAARDSYFKGHRFLYKLATPGASQRAREYFEHALDLDPRFAAAWAGLAGAYHQLVIQGALPASDGEPRSLMAADSALALDPDLADAHRERAAVFSWYYGDPEEAEREFQRALDLKPSDARTLRFYGVHLRNHRRFDEALDLVEKARRLEPLSPGNYLQKGLILYMARRYEEALETYELVLTIDPQYVATYFYMALTYVQMDRYNDALDALQRQAPGINQGGGVSILGYVRARRGEVEEARRILRQLEGAPLAQAIIYVGLGENDRALDMMEQALEKRPWQMQMLNIEPVWDPLRSEPRFQVLLETLKLTD